MADEEKRAGAERAREQAQALQEAAREGERAAGILSDAFETTADRITASLERAARSGRLEIDAMVESIAQSLASLALDEFVFAPVDRLVAGLSRTVIGARAEGGPVMACSPYLVGERGPEVFVPNGAGAIAPMAAGPTVNVTILAAPGREADAVRRSERQISAVLARAVRAGSASL